MKTFVPAPSIPSRTRAQGDSCSLSRRRLRIACLFEDPTHGPALGLELAAYCPEILLEPLADPCQVALGEHPAAHRLLVLDGYGARALAPRIRALPACERPEVILVGVPPLDALRLRDEAMGPAVEIPGPFYPATVVVAVRQAVAFRLPVRELCVRLVGAVDLPEVLGMVRYYMLTSALVQGRSKKSAARLLGVTRAAVQQMARSVAGQSGPAAGCNPHP